MPTFGQRAINTANWNNVDESAYFGGVGFAKRLVDVATVAPSNESELVIGNELLAARNLEDGVAFHRLR